MPGNFSTRERWLWCVFVCTGILLTGYHLVYRPFIKEKRALDGRVDTAQKTIRRSRHLQQAAQEWRTRCRQILPLYADAARDQPLLPFLVSRIQALVSEEDVRITDMRPKITTDRDGMPVFETTVTAEGACDALMALVYRLQDAQYFFSITRFRLERRTGRGKTLVARITVSKILPGAPGRETAVGKEVR